MNFLSRSVFKYYTNDTNFTKRIRNNQLKRTKRTGAKVFLKFSNKPEFY